MKRTTRTVLCNLYIIVSNCTYHKEFKSFMEVFSPREPLVLDTSVYWFKYCVLSRLSPSTGYPKSYNLFSFSLLHYTSPTLSWIPVVSLLVSIFYSWSEVLLFKGYAYIGHALEIGKWRGGRGFVRSSPPLHGETIKWIEVPPNWKFFGISRSTRCGTNLLSFW